MANTVKLKRSATASKVPLTTDLQLGELAVNTYDGKLYIKKDNGTASVVEINGLPTSGGTLTGSVANTSTGYLQVSVGTTAQRPGSPTAGMIRFNTSRSCFEGYTGSAWVNMSPLTIDDVGAS
jgi:glucose/arabinose dehydrogenase